MRPRAVTRRGRYTVNLEAALARAQPQSVRVGYDAQVAWKDVLAVFNACEKAHIAKRALVRYAVPQYVPRRTAL